MGKTTKIDENRDEKIPSIYGITQTEAVEMLKEKFPEYNPNEEEIITFDDYYKLRFKLKMNRFKNKLIKWWNT